MIWALFRAVTGSFMGRMVAVGLAALAALGINNAVQRSIGGKKAIAKVIQKSNEVANERDKKVRKIRRNISTSTAWKRLRTEYANTD